MTNEAAAIVFNRPGDGDGYSPRKVKDGLFFGKVHSVDKATGGLLSLSLAV
jgi:hypothetical protein